MVQYRDLHALYLQHYESKKSTLVFQPKFEDSTSVARIIHSKDLHTLYLSYRRSKDMTLVLRVV